MPSKSQSARINGSKSRGPTTPAGRARSSQNALKHGLTSQSLLLPSEDPGEFHHLLASYLHKLQPDGPVELALVHEMVAAKWRLDRIAAIETQLFGEAIDHVEEYADDPLNELQALAHGFERIANSSSFSFLYRIESRLTRAYSRALRNLLQLQKLREPSTTGASDSATAEPVAPEPPALSEIENCINEPTGPAANPGPSTYLCSSTRPPLTPTADAPIRRSP